MNVLYLPGGGTSRANYPYDKILRKIQRRGHKTVFCPITWRGTTINDWVDEVQPMYQKYEAAQTILVGFSYAAMASLLLTVRRPPAGLILCSLSPYFAEDLHLVPDRWIRYMQRFNPRRLEVFKALRFADIAPRITCPTRLVTGSEPEWGQQRTRAASVALPGGQIFVGKNAGHSPVKWSYITALDKAFDSLRTDVPLA